MSDVSASTYYLTVGGSGAALLSLGVISAMSAQDDTVKGYVKGKYYARWVASIGILGGLGLLVWLGYRFYSTKK